MELILLVGQCVALFCMLIGLDAAIEARTARWPWITGILFIGASMALTMLHMISPYVFS